MTARFCGTCGATISQDDAAPRNWLGRTWVVVAVALVMAIAIPGSIYLNYELGRRLQLCQSALTMRDLIVRKNENPIGWTHVASRHPDVVAQLRTYCGMS
jgi:hypothetical protein